MKLNEIKGKVRKRDLKSLDTKYRAGSIPAPGTIPVKKAVASNALLPNVAIIDPMLTVSCPPHVTASAGIDAFIHAAEPFISKNANAVTEVIALEVSKK